MTTEGWPDDRLTSADAPTVVRHHAGPADDPDRYELLGEAEGADEAWHVLDHRAQAGGGLFTLAALRPTAVDGLEVVHGDQASPERIWRERAAGLAKVRHARLAGVVDTFAGSAPHAPGQSAEDSAQWSYAVLEQAAGRSVADWLRDDPGAAVDERFTVLATAAGVLQELHRGSEDAPPLVHGDITPRTVRLGGFWPADGVRLAGASLGGLRSGPVAGNVSSPYTAPEVRAGALPSAASDVFGFGATAVLVLTGQPPAQDPDGGVDPALVRRQLAASPLTAPHPGLADLLLQALAENPRDRPDRLPGWVNAMRLHVEPLAVLDPYDDHASYDDERYDDGRYRDDRYQDEQAVGHRPAATGALARVRALPQRPVVVVVGALILATAGTAVAIAAVQAGRLAEVPNPVAIVQPPPVETTVPTSAPGVTAAPAPSQESSGAEEGAASDAPNAVRTGQSSQDFASRVPTSFPGLDPSSSVSPLDTGVQTAPVLPPGAALLPEVPTTTVLPPLVGPTAPPTTPSFPPTLIPPVVTTTPPTTVPPTTRPPTTVPPTTVPPTSVPPTTAPTLIPPVVTTAPTTPPTSEPPTTAPTSEPPTSDPTVEPTTEPTGGVTVVPDPPVTSSAPAETETGTDTPTGSATDTATATDSADPTETSTRGTGRFFRP